MISTVHRDTNVKKHLKALHKAGGRAALVAGHAEAVMEKLALTQDTSELKQAGRLTRYGEARIKKCIKFDLIDGYRLLAIRQGRDTRFLYIGTHDECDRWLRNNSGLRSVPQKDDSEAVSVPELLPDAPPDEDEFESGPDCDEYLSAELDEKTMRQVFSGLAGK